MSRKNLFIDMSDRELIFYYEYYNRMFSISKKDDNPFYDYVCSYVRMMENESHYVFFDDDKKYNIAFSIAERDLLNVIARRFVEIGELWNKLTKRFK